MEKETYDCTIIGAGPGGLQASIYLGRYNRRVLLIDRSGGRTWHARKIENFLTQQSISGKDIIRTGMEQARRFNVAIEKGEVLRVSKNNGNFEISTKTAAYFSRFVVVSSGAYDNLPSLESYDRQETRHSRKLAPYGSSCLRHEGDVYERYHLDPLQL